MNILVIMADQFAAHALHRSRDTDAHFRTPNLDRLAAASVSYTQAYTPFPLCVPARSAMVTGRYPHELGIMSNAKGKTEPGHAPASLGHWFAAAGYDCAYAGKWHAQQASATARDGFAPIHPFGDEGLAEACAEWLGARATDRPFLLVASFDDPHTICEYARSQPMPYGDVPASPVEDTPPLPANHLRAPYSPAALRTEAEAAERMYGTRDYTPDDWRRYRGAYAALVKRVDQRIGLLLDAIDLADTAVVFVSDHGDGDAAHGWNQKTALYQECIRVPFLLHAPGLAPGTVGTPVAAVLGLLATLCAVAGIPAPDGLSAGSVLAADPGPVVVETGFGDGAANQAGPHTTGRALLRARFKYTVYNWGLHREQLHDVVADPGEQRNLAVESAFLPVLEDMRMDLLRWALATNDTAFLKKLVLPAAASEAARREIFAVPY
ncbi:sulfatase [Specibacter cremeus]|uniref:sulfatase family protein n=1 Tax=Specibacter cremeus TaxID=1629051 RepID=UPI000F77A723|nr:sulfatase-like hydrolase/transferase [Specibacter cremeus]